jgi:hypothetical protein
MQRYTCLESALIISPFNLPASFAAKRVFPVAVGPNTVIRLKGKSLIGVISCRIDISKLY